MARPFRLRVTRGGLVATLIALAAPGATHAAVTSDLINWDLHEYVTTYGAGNQYRISSIGDGSVNYRWLDVTDRQTVISANSCSDYSLYGSHTYNAGVTLYRNLFWGSSGLCFVMRGRTATGTGSMYNKDGRVDR